jgi:hypothetical protein
MDAATLLKEAIAATSNYESELLSSGLEQDDLVPTTRYLAALRVLRDLVSQGWNLRFDDEGLVLDSPDSVSSQEDEPERKKEALRRSFSFAREAQLAEPATERFISAMERRGIGALFADGSELAERLTQLSSNKISIVPQLELIESGARDSTTGILLQDVWRYARHYWSIPYQSTPGRNMFYLVRDAALPSRPLIGIAALGNPVLGLSQRDHFYGWSLKGLRRILEGSLSHQHRTIAAHLYETISEGMDEVYSDDLLSEELPDSWRETVKTLEEIKHESAEERLEQLEKAGDHRDAGYKVVREAHSAVGRGEEETVDWITVAKTPLYKRKRAGTLSDLVRAHGILTDLGFSSEGGPIQKALDSEEGIRAVEIALRRIKQQVIASSVMELITCGAVPPYREVLGGKLTAMLMSSSEVVENFEEKYSGRVSLIASALAGHPVYRSTRLALITTSSLYAVGSSQYNRIKIPTDSGNLSYKRIGKTESFGTVHFAPDTVMSLSILARASDANRRQVNNLFGEGTSPKLRLVRSGLEALGLNSDTFLRHHSPRLLYGASLCSNIDDVMLGVSETPEYLLPPGSKSTEILVQHWRERWLSGRSGRQDILERLRVQNFEGFRLGHEIVALNEGDRRRRATQVGNGTPLSRDQGIVENSDQTFIEKLYRSSKSYADRLSTEELETIHVDLGVDDHLVAQAEAGRQIVVTGNPGDGKTHLIERLRTQLEAAGAQVITDANACSNTEILETWRTCRREEHPFVLAINEWPLYVLRRHTRDEEQFAEVRGAVEEALRQVDSARFFVEAQLPEPPKENVIVIDLSLRNLLAPSVVEQVVQRLTQERFYTGLNPADPMLSNREALQNPQVLERLTDLLRMVGDRVGHVTMRQLVGFVSFLLTGGQSAADRLRAGQDAAGFSYSNLAFEGGVGRLFDAVRNIFDPAAITHPEWDERLWMGETEDRDWLEQTPPGLLALPEVERENAYRAIKRRFFFEHSW